MRWGIGGLLGGSGRLNGDEMENQSVGINFKQKKVNGS
jgi:hypothetical protein